MSAPKGIKDHPLVDSVESGGWGGEPSYPGAKDGKKYFVHLKDGYWFSDYETGSKSFNTAKEFKAATIEKRTDNE
jgi:hypothetical protein